MRAAVVGLLVVTAFVLSGCQYLLGGMMGVPVGPVLGGGSFDPGDFGSFDAGGFGSFDPGDFGSMPPPLAVFTTGSASVTVAGKTTTLDTMNSGAAIYPEYGTAIGWTDGDGTYVHFYGETDPTYGDGFVMLDRIANGQHWTIYDPSGCKVTVKQNDAKGVSGTASCKGLRWVDAMSAAEPGEPSLVPGQAPFDAEITFQAAP